MVDYNKKIEEIEKRKKRAEERAERKAKEELIKLNKDEVVKIVRTQYEYTYEGGYGGDEIITRTMDRYTVYIGKEKLKEFSWPQDAINYVNSTFVPKEQSKSLRRLANKNKKADKLQKEVSDLQFEAAKLKYGIYVDSR